MGKNTIAESIIIRVGGGIREVYRRPADPGDAGEPSSHEPSGEMPPEGAQVFQPEYEPPL